MGDKFNFSGDFSGSIINIKSKLDHVHQVAGQIPGASLDERKQLQELVKSLGAELDKVPTDKKEEAEAVAITATALVEQVKGKKTNKTLLKVTAEGLKSAANNLAPILPALLPIIHQMITISTKISGVA
jgi:hypothetical protein